MTAEEIELWRYAIERASTAWMWGAFWLGMGLGSISVKNIINGCKK